MVVVPGGKQYSPMGSSLFFFFATGIRTCMLESSRDAARRV